MPTDDARLLADDPRGLFGSSAKMFAVPYDEIRELQLEALRARFDALLPRVQLLSRLAERNGVEGIDDLATGGQLLYPSNVYKSYVFSWLTEGEYDRLTRWLQQLTAHDLSAVNVEGIQSLDEWFDRLEAVTDLRLCHSSSTSGKLSFVPRGTDEWVRRSATLPFASEAGGIDDGPQHVSFEGLPIVLPFYRSGHSAAIMHFDWFIRVHTDPGGNHPDRVLTLYSGALSSDLMVLAGRLRSGQLSGDPRSLQLPERLLDRRAELSALLEGTAEEQMQAFVATAAERFSGQRCVVTGVWPTMVDAATASLARSGSDTCSTPRRSCCRAAERRDERCPRTPYQRVLDWTGVDRVEEAYGMSELMGKNSKCSAGNFHINPWLIPYVLDVESLEALPSEGTKTGRLAGIDLMASSYWSGYISTDLVTITWDPTCSCERQGPYLAP